uniref:SET domain-containing protein n=1 Tax=Caenorhabditis japonica TaxID=281687 RepID=A0A8R1HLQ6_CAEJA
MKSKVSISPQNINIEKLVREAMAMTDKMWWHHNNPGNKPENGKMNLTELRKKQSEEVPEEMQEIISKAIKDGVQAMILRTEKNRKCVKMNGINLFVNESEFGYEMTDNAYCEYMPTNHIACHSMAATTVMEAEAEEDLFCHCKDGKCTASCKCRVIEEMFKNQRAYRKADRRYHSCSFECDCKGQCRSSVKDAPEEGTEVMLHHITEKGFAVRAKQYFAPGETVAEMTGELVPTNTLARDDPYAIDIFNAEYDGKELLDFLDGKFIGAHKTVKKYSKSYIRNLENLYENDFSINPTDFSTAGRFMSSSCFPNVKTTIVYSGGANPLRARAIFTAVMPIFPNMEISFNYGIDYIFQQLKDVCKCGMLCCVTNSHLYEYLRDEHWKRFFKELYQAVYPEFKENVINEIKGKLPQPLFDSKKKKKNSASRRKINILSRARKATLRSNRATL